MRGEQNMKTLKNNKKGFTLIEIIVVLIIMGILLAIAVPAILGYVGQAKDAQYLAEARGGYVAAQTITAKSAAKSEKDADGKYPAPVINKTKINEELGLEDGDDGAATNAFCVLTADNKNVVSCSITVDGLTTKYAHFEGKEATIVKGTVVDGTSATPAS